MLSRNNLKVI